MYMHSFMNTTCDIKATYADGSVYCHPRYSADTPSCIASCAALLWVRLVGLRDEQKERLYGKATSYTQFLGIRRSGLVFNISIFVGSRSRSER